MGRAPRIQVEKGLYYILSGGDNSEPIFRLADDSATYLELLAKHKKLHQFKLFAYCLVPGSISLLIEPSASTTISGIMHDLNSKYTKYFNRKYGKTGHLFQERYRMVVIEKESKLLEMTAYINLRPKLQIPPYDITTYEYSSYMAYIKEGEAAGKPDIGEEVKEVASHLKGATYQEILAQIALNRLKDLDEELATKPVLGSDKFVKEVKSKMKIDKSKAAETPESVIEPEPEPVLEPEAEPEPQPEPELEQLLEPVPEPSPRPKTEPVPDTIFRIESVPETLPNPEAVPAQKQETVSDTVPDTKPILKPRYSILRALLIISLVIIIASGAFVFVYMKTNQMKEYLNKELARKDTELKNRLDKERKSLYKTLTDRYETEKVVYQDRAQRLESEKETYKTTAETLENEKKVFEDTAKRLSEEKASAQARAESLEQEKKKIEEQLILIQKQPSSL